MSLQLEINNFAIVESAKIARKYGRTVVLKTSPLSAPKYKTLQSMQLFDYVDVMIVNEFEAVILLERTDCK